MSTTSAHSHTFKLPKPTISNITDTDETMSFECDNINVSVINSIRRVILSEIDTVVIRVEPHEKSDVIIHKNISRINNEMLKQRLACIPIHISDSSIDVENYLVEVNVVNNENAIRLVTTEDFKIKNIKTGTYLADDETRKIFPSHPLTGEYISFTRLQPKISAGHNAETIHLEAKMTRSNASESGAYNVVSCCSYMMAPDVVKQREMWTEKEEEAKAKGLELGEQERKDWELLEAQRIYKKDAFVFFIETIGVYTNQDIIKKACNVMLEKLDTIKMKINKGELDITKGKNVMDCMDIILEGENYTLGKVLEYGIHKLYFEDQPYLSYVGFNKFHPHDDYSVIRISKDTNYDKSSKQEPLTKERIHSILENVCDEISKIYIDIIRQL